MKLRRLAILFAAGGCALAAPASNRIPLTGAGPESWKDDLRPIGVSDWNYQRAAHLLERAGFGGTPAEISALAKMTPQAAVASLVNYESIANPLPPFDESGIWSKEMLADLDGYPTFADALRKAYSEGSTYGVKANSGGTRRLQSNIDIMYYRLYAGRYEWMRASVWWANRMLKTKRPLEEKMTLFWHSHFATEHEKVADYRLMLKQIGMLRDNATGNFRDLLIGIGKDPAMLIYLDNRKNVNGHANENFAREVMELFSLGAGNYTEKDVKEAARAFTGWDSHGMNFVYRPEKHDEGVKTVLGKAGNFSGEDVVDILLQRKAAAEFISKKLYKFLVREDVSSELNASLAAALRDNQYRIKPFLTAILLSRDFYSAPSFGTQIKSPVQYVISTYRKLGLAEVPGTPYFPVIMSGLGQTLGNPPNVKGWDGGKAWLNPSTLLQRGNLLRHLLFPDEVAPDVYARNVIPARYENADKEAEERDRQAASGEAVSKPAPDAGGEAMMMAPSSNRLAKAPDYDLKLGVFRGYQRTFATAKPSPPTPASLSLKEITKVAGVKSAGDAVDYFTTRFLSGPLEEGDRAKIVAYAERQLSSKTLDFTAGNIETALRNILYVVLSMPEYQLS